AVKYRCPAMHEGLPCPSQERCNAGKKYGLTVRVRCADDLRRFPPIGRATKRFERVYKGRTAGEGGGGGLEVFLGGAGGKRAGGGGAGVLGRCGGGDGGGWGRGPLAGDAAALGGRLPGPGWPAQTKRKDLHPRMPLPE